MPAGRARHPRLSLALKLGYGCAFRFPTHHQAVGGAAIAHFPKIKTAFSGFYFEK